MVNFNALSVLTVRMQNVDYAHNKNMRKAVVDMVKTDKHRMFYRGAFSLFMSYFTLSFTNSMVYATRRDEETMYTWPLIYVLGTLIAHPFMVIGMRV